MLASILVIVLMLFIVYYSKDNVLFFKNIIDSILIEFGSNYNVIVYLVVLIILEFINMIISGYIGIMIGHLSNNHKVVHSIISGFIISYTIFAASTKVSLSLPNICCAIGLSHSSI